jgi:hypothetical protein
VKNKSLAAHPLGKTKPSRSGTEKDDRSEPTGQEKSLTQ